MVMMKMKVLAALGGAIAAAVVGRTSALDAYCKQYWVNDGTNDHDPFTCKDDTGAVFKPKAEDVTRWTCGGTAKTACHVAKGTIADDASEDCNKCYLVTYTQKAVSDDTICAAGGCPDFIRKVFVKAVDAAKADAYMELSGVALQRLCPYMCADDKGVVASDPPVCVEDPAYCKSNQIVKDSNPVVNGVKQPGVCTVDTLKWDVTSVKLVDCSGDVEGKSPVPAALADPEKPEEVDGYVTKFTESTETAPSVPTPMDAKAACHKYWVNDGTSDHPDLTCKATDGTTAQKPVADDVWRWKCGKSLATPCLAAAKTITAAGVDGCNKCFLVTYKQEAVSNEVVCAAGGCPEFTRQVYVKTVDKPDDANVDLELSGVAMQRICPYVCKDSDAYNNKSAVCVEDPAWCQGGFVHDDVLEKGVKQPGACLADPDAEWSVTQTEIDCGVDPAPEDGSETPGDLSGVDQPADPDSYKEPFVARPTEKPTLPPTGTFARCRKYWVTDHPDLTCKKDGATQKPVDDDVHRWKCGKSLKTPCLAAAKNITADGADDCNKCYAITYKQKESTDAACKEKCPSFTRNVYVKTVDAPEEASVDFELSGVAMQRICPYVCKDAAGAATSPPICVVDPAHCKDGSTMEDSSVVNGVKHPGSCLDSTDAKWEITFEKIDCGAAPADASYTPTDLADATKPETGSYNKTFATPSNSGSAGGRRATATFAAAAAVGSLAVWLM